MVKKKKSNGNPVMKLAKESVGVGVATTAGGVAIGAIAGVHGFPAAGAAGLGTAMAGLNLVNVGQLARTGLGITNMMVPKNKKKSSDPRVRKILG